MRIRGTLGYVPLLLLCTEVSTRSFLGCRKFAAQERSRKIASSATLAKKELLKQCMFK